MELEVSLKREKKEVSGCMDLSREDSCFCVAFFCRWKTRLGPSDELQAKKMSGSEFQGSL